MPRPRTPVGQTGKINVVQQYLTVTVRDDGTQRDEWKTLPQGSKPPRGTQTRWRARARVREADGGSRQVEALGATKAKAEAQLMQNIAQRVSNREEGITGSTLLSVLAETWLETVDRADRADGTKVIYRGMWERNLRPLLGSLTVREAKVPALDRALRSITDTRGPAAAKTAKSVLMGMFKLAVRHQAIATNPVRDVEKIRMSAPSPVRKRHTNGDAPRVLTPEEEAQLYSVLDKPEYRDVYDVSDLVEFMLGTGVRIGEACAVRWQDLDLDVGTVRINATMVRIKGQGVVRKDGTKTKAGRRVLGLPAFVVTMLERRRVERPIHPEDVIFTSPSGRLMDPSNTAKRLRGLLDEAGLYDVTSHAFRRTVGTKLYEQSKSLTLVRDHLGHTNSATTLEHYLGQTQPDTTALTALERVPSLKIVRQSAG